MQARILVSVVTFLLILPALAQPMQQDADLIRAKEICDKHRLSPRPTFGPVPGQSRKEYEDGWDQCISIMAKYRESAAGIAERQKAEQDEADRRHTLDLLNR